VRKTSVIPAAVLAAGFFFGASASAEAASAHHKRLVAGSKTTVSSPTQTHKKKTVSAHKTAKKAPKKAQHRIHQTPEGDVVLDQVAVEAVQFYGPFLPVEAFDYPQPPCTEFDAVVEAHVHETDAETPEPDDVAEAVPEEEAPVNALTRVARTLGALLRPKSAQSTVRPEDVDLSDLLSAGVQIPVEGVDASGLQDSFLNSRGRHRQHLAIDIGAPKGTPVLAAADGQISQLRREQRGGISLYQKDASGKYLLFYCHLTKYAKGLKPGDQVSKGDVIAYVGRTGHVIGGPHLHFSITRLPEDDDNFKAGVAINPYLLFLAAVP
jgi:peptidoglycan LD-endopeptidase LytH